MDVSRFAKLLIDDFEKVKIAGATMLRRMLIIAIHLTLISSRPIHRVNSFFDQPVKG